MRIMPPVAACLACLTFLFCGCIYHDASEWKKCSFDVASVRYAGIRENQTEWEIVLDVHNPGSDRLKMEGVQLYALSGTDTLATLHNQNPLDVAPAGTTPVSLKAASPSAAWNKALEVFRRDGKCSVVITGDAVYHGTFGMKKYPNLFHKTYDVDMAMVLGAMGGGLFQGMQGLPFSF